MNQRPQMRRRVCLTALLTSLILSPAYAGSTTTQKHVIKIQATGAEVIEADVSALQPGEAMSFTTENGQLIDILKGVKGVEIYLDGELIGSPPDRERRALDNAVFLERLHACEDTGAADCEALHGHILHREMEIYCTAENDADCETVSIFEAGDDAVLEEWIDDGDENIIVIRQAHHVVESD